MIQSFRHKGIEHFFLTGSLKGIQAQHARKLAVQLFTLNRASLPEEMNLHGWDCHALKGELSGHWAVKVNGNWRLTFRFEDQNAILVDYQDYH